MYDCWRGAIHKRRQSKKPPSIAMFVSWEVWKEINVRVFRNNSIAMTMINNKFKEEAALWSLAGAKKISNIMPRG
jgi:hypothetical protein